MLPNAIELSRCDRRWAKRKQSPPKGAVGESERSGTTTSPNQEKKRS